MTRGTTPTITSPRFPAREGRESLQSDFTSRLKEDFRVPCHDPVDAGGGRLVLKWADGGKGLVGPRVAFGTPADRKAGRSLPLFWNELDLRGHRVMARWLCDSNAFAIGFSGRLTDYHIRKGFGWQACLKGAKKTPYATAGANADPLVAKAQNILDTWRDTNKWPLRSREAFKRWRRDGEVFGRFFRSGWDRLPLFPLRAELRTGGQSNGRHPRRTSRSASRRTLTTWNRGGRITCGVWTTTGRASGSMVT